MRHRSRPNYQTIVANHVSSDVEGLHVVLADGHDGGNTYHELITTSGYADVPAFLSLASNVFREAGEGTVIIDRPPVSVWNDGDIIRQAVEFTEIARREGWKVTGDELQSGWLTLTSPKQPAMHIGIVGAMSVDSIAYMGLKDPPQIVAERLARFSALIGAAYRVMPGVAAVGAVRNLFDRITTVKNGDNSITEIRRRQPTWNLISKGILDPRSRLDGCGDLVWQRLLSDDERQLVRDMPHVEAHAMDTRAAYLAASAGALLPFTGLEHTGVEPWTLDRIGYFRINARDPRWSNLCNLRMRGREAYGPPLINPAKIDSRGYVWVTHPIIKALYSVGHVIPVVVDSYTTLKGGYYLRPWAETIRDALTPFQTARDETLRASVKLSYKEAVGLFGRTGGRIHRPDWMHIIKDEARARLWIKARQIHAEFGQWPVKAKTDCLWYVGWHLGSGDEIVSIGRLKHDVKKCVELGKWMDESR